MLANCLIHQILPVNCLLLLFGNSLILPEEMAPSATSEIVLSEAGVAKHQVEKHIHGSEEKTPLEAISHGPIVQAGETVSPLSSFPIYRKRASEPQATQNYYTQFFFLMPQIYLHIKLIECYYSRFGARHTHDSLVQAFQNFLLTKNIESISSSTLRRYSAIFPEKASQKANLVTFLSEIPNLSTIYG